LRRTFDTQSHARALVLGLADGSPHLWDLVRADPMRLLHLLQSDPDARLDAVLAEAVGAIAATPDEAAAMRLLRRMKAEASLLIALADIGHVWPVMRVTKALTDLADAAVGAAVRYLLGQAEREGKLRPGEAAVPEAGTGYIALAMGKMGAGELNYSSDIDLIVFYDAGAPRGATGEPGPFYVRLTRGLVKLLQERTPDGYVFRTDLRLRPDPGSTQIAVSTAAALDYYESVGRNWERAAMIKARACAGDIAAGDKLLRELSPFIWRKYLDFAAVADIHSMKRQIHAYRGHGEIAVEGHNVKLGRGGIREIEFFVQTQQLIAGGRHPELRGRQTLAMLDVLADGDWIGAEARDELRAAYEFLRMVEHRLQMVADEQTHSLPRDQEELERFARFLGFADRDSSPRPCWAICAMCSGNTPLSSRARRMPRHAPARSRSRPRPTTARLSTSSPRWDSRSHSKPRPACGNGCRAVIARCGENMPAINLRSWCRCCSPTSPAPPTPTPLYWPSIAS
jgi:glutamate-ammonia-ligase adenylyltransferase